MMASPVAPCMGAGNPLEHLYRPQQRQNGAESAKGRQFVCSYNVLSTRRDGRLTTILQAMSNAAIICGQGTRQRQQSEKVVTRSHMDGFYVYRAGYSKVTNSHAGLFMAFRDNCFQEHQLQWHVP